jgi:glutaminyl-peptide cyclotransferase
MRPLRNFNRLTLLFAAALIVGCNDAPETISVAATDSANDVLVPQVISYNIVNQYPHDTKAFTEGLEFRDGFLYESTGQYDISDIRKVDLTTGKVLQVNKMDGRYFGEGLTILNGKIYQLTYREGKGFVYDLATLKQEASFPFHTQEGWGMTNNGTHLIFCDGGSTLYFQDPATSKVIKQLSVTDERGPVAEINELELINGYIYANRWRYDVILKIDTATGKVVARADLSSIRQQAGIPALSGREDGPDVLNGIAYDAATNRIFITGKNWPKLFEIRLDN